MSQPCRILYVVDRLSVGGIEDQILTIARAFERERFQPEVLALYEEGPLAPEFREAGIPVHVLEARPGSWVRNMAAYIAFARRHRYELVHVVIASSALTARTGALIARQGKVLVSVENTYFWRTRLQKLADRALARFTAAIVCNSEAVRASVVAQIGTRPGLISVHHSFVDTDKIRPATDRQEIRKAVRGELEVPEGTALLASLGTLKKQKDMATLIEALPGIEERSGPAVLAVMGDGPLRSELEALARDRGVSGRVRFLGMRRDYARILEAADLYLHAARWEGFSLAILEAMALARPIVASRIPPIEEALVDGESGVLATPGDPAAFASAVAALLSDPGRRASVAAAARARCVDRFSVRARLPDLEQLYLDLSGHSGTTSAAIHPEARAMRRGA